MAQEVGLFEGIKTFQTQYSPLVSDETLQRVRAVTAWALFKYSSSVSSPGLLNTIAYEEGSLSYAQGNNHAKTTYCSHARWRTS